jgi:hypothetical protein
VRGLAGGITTATSVIPKDGLSSMLDEGQEGSTRHCCERHACNCEDHLANQFLLTSLQWTSTNQFTLVVVSADSTCSAHCQPIICRYLSKRFEIYDQVEYKPERTSIRFYKPVMGGQNDMATNTRTALASSR